MQKELRRFILRMRYRVSGDKYQGEFWHGKPEGQGVLNYTNGDHYEGAFMNGTFEGKGVYYFHTGGKRKAFGKMVNICGDFR